MKKVTILPPNVPHPNGGISVSIFSAISYFESNGTIILNPEKLALAFSCLHWKVQCDMEEGTPEIFVIDDIPECGLIIEHYAHLARINGYTLTLISKNNG